jgi:hypothetical protein
MNSEKKVVFRRINGRVVPIRVTAADVAASGGLVGAGAAVAAASGVYASNLVRDAASAENAARKALSRSRFAVKQAEALGPLFAGPAKKAHLKAGEGALRTMVESRRLFDASLKARNIGFGIGSTLIGAGVYQGLKHTHLNDDTKTKIGIAGGVATATHFAIRSGFLKGIGGRGVKVSAALAQAVRDVLKGGAR